MTETYWAAAPSEEIADKISEMVDIFDRRLRDTGRLRLAQRAIDTYYGFDPDGKWSRSSAVTFGGEQGEIALLQLNHFRSIVDQRIIMVIGQRPSFEAMANSTAFESTEQVGLAERIFDYHLTKGGLEELSQFAVKNCRLTGEGWMFCGWDPHKGDVYGVDPETGTRIYTGEPSFKVYSMYDVIRDTSSPYFEREWVILRRFENRWNLMAKYPEKADKIKGVSITDYVKLQDTPYRNMNTLSTLGSQNTDLICVYEMYHAKTPAVPEGRFVLMTGDIVLYDGPNPYEEIPIYPIVEDVEQDSCFGYSSDWDLIGPQQAINSAISTIVTNHDAFGIQNVIVPLGAGIQPSEIAGGLRILEMNMSAGKPEVLHLTQTGDASYKLIDLLEKTQETISAVNSVARGNPQASLKSGTALAQVQSMALQGNSKLTNAYVRFLESVGTALVRRYQQFATMPHLIDIVGPDKRTAVEVFTGDKLSTIKRITVSLGGPLMRTQSGRMEVASDLAERWPDTVSPAQYLQVLETGRLENITEQPTAEPNYINWENQQLRNGNPVKAIFFEQHELHIKEHLVLMFDPDLRDEMAHPELEPIRQNVLQHIQQHQDMLNAINESKVQQQQKSEQMKKPSPAPQPRAEANPTYQNTSGEGGKGPLLPKNPTTGIRSSPTGSNA
jgi:hypothetical protein